MQLSAISSAIRNDVLSGLRGYHSTPTMNILQIEDEVIEERYTVIKEWFLRKYLNKRDYMLAINCIELDCKDPSRCCEIQLGEAVQHFEIPQLMNDLGDDAIEFVGSTDRMVNFKVYFNRNFKYQKYRRRHGNMPYVYIETTPNENGLYDGFLYNAPFAKYISVIGIFKDPRQLEKYKCCTDTEYLDIGAVSNEVKKRLTQRKLYYYRQLLAPVEPNTQVPT